MNVITPHLTCNRSPIHFPMFITGNEHPPVITLSRERNERQIAKEQGPLFRPTRSRENDPPIRAHLQTAVYRSAAAGDDSLERKATDACIPDVAGLCELAPTQRGRFEGLAISLKARGPRSPARAQPAAARSSLADTDI